MILAQWGFTVLSLAWVLLISGFFKKNVLNLVSIARFACILVGASFLCLVLCFLRDDFSVVYVLRNSSTLLPWYYKICAVWGGHEGSVLLWVTILSFWTWILTFQMPKMDSVFARHCLQVLMVILLGLVGFILLTSNPFQLQFEEVKTLGKDLNPLLQDPGFLLHPPLLYFGYVGFALPFAFAMAALACGEWSPKHMLLLKPWVLWAWTCLTVGICLGSWWAYRELGWGGFWFWDPVENASLMPWLVGTALLHAILVNEKQQSLLAWTILLAVTAFALSLIGTFLVRSGVLTSVHAFAVDPKRGLYILLFLAAMIAWAFGLYLFKSHHLWMNKPLFWFSRESSILMNNLILFVMMLVVLLGTLYPLIMDGLGLGKLSVGAPYFNTVMTPMIALLLLIMGLGIHIKWQKDKARLVLKKLIIPMLLSMLFAYLLLPQWHWSSGLILALAIWVILSLAWSLSQRRYLQGHLPKSLSYWAMWVAHLGVAVSIIGIVVSSSLGIEKDLKMQPGEIVSIGSHQVQFIKEIPMQGSNYHGSAVEFLLDEKLSIFPEKRIYAIGQVVMTDAAVDATLFRDIYLALGEPIGHHAWAVRVYFKPFIRWIWLGGLLMAFGGVLALYQWSKHA